MSLVKAENDDSFVAEVAGEVQASCKGMNEHVSAMIKEYLQRRVEQARRDAQQECNVQVEQIKQTVATAESERAAAEERCAFVKKQLAEAAETLHRKDARLRLLGCFLSWKRGVERRREQCRLAEESSRRGRCLAVYQAYLQWRLFAAVRRGTNVEADELKKRESREQELLGQLGAYRELLKTEQAKNETLNEKLKEAFVRGMSALNREAVQVLHGSDDKQGDDDVEAIAEILSRSGHSQKLSTSRDKTESMTHSSAQHQSICPVHQVDRSGHFYHRCYAPGYCEYYARHSRSRTPPSLSSESPALPSPFVVRADPQAVRNFDAGVSVPLRHAPKPSQTRWKM